MFIRRLPLGPACPLCSTGCIPIQSAELGWAQVLAVNMLAVNLVITMASNPFAMTSNLVAVSLCV